MNPISVPVSPAPPAGLQTFDLAKLGLFKEFTRDEFEKAFGVQAPDFNAAKPVKLWFDTSLAGAAPKYSTVDAMTGKYVNLVMSSEDAAAVNIPGGHRYAAWVVAPTGATRGGSTVNPKYLSSKTQADAIAAELGGVATEYDGGAYYPIFYPEMETRRWHQVTVAGVDYNVGILLAQKYANGIDAPGRWQNDPGNVYWVSTYVPLPPVVSSPKVAMPMRDLLPGERLYRPMIGVFQVVAAGVTLPGETSGTGGAGLTAEEHAALMECRDSLRKIQGQ